MNRNDQDPPADTGATPAGTDRPAAAADAAPPADGETGQPGAESRSRGSDPPKQSGQPAARHAGDGATEPATATEIDRSTDA